MLTNPAVSKKKKGPSSSDSSTINPVKDIDDDTQKYQLMKGVGGGGGSSVGGSSGGDQEMMTMMMNDSINSSAPSRHKEMQPQHQQQLQLKRKRTDQNITSLNNSFEEEEDGDSTIVGSEEHIRRRMKPQDVGNKNNKKVGDAKAPPPPHQVSKQHSRSTSDEEGEASSTLVSSETSLKLLEDPALAAVIAFENREPKGLIEIVYVTDETGTILSLDEPTWNQWLLQNCELPIPSRIKRCLSPEITGRNLFEFIGDPKVQVLSRHILYMLSTGQQRQYQYYWFCDSADLQRKMHMTVTHTTQPQGNKVILWVSKILAETILYPAQSYLNSPPVNIATSNIENDTNIVGTTSKAASETPKTTNDSSSNSADDSTTNSRTDNNKSNSSSTANEDRKTRAVCSYCKRIMVLCEELRAHTVKAILTGEAAQPQPADAACKPFLGLSGKLGMQTHKDMAMPPNHLWLTPQQYYVEAELGTEACSIHHGVCEVCYKEIGDIFFPPGSFVDGVSAVTVNSQPYM